MQGFTDSVAFEMNDSILAKLHLVGVVTVVKYSLKIVLVIGDEKLLLNNTILTPYACTVLKIPFGYSS